MAVKKKVKVRARPKTGLAAAPLDDFDKLQWYSHYELDKKLAVDLQKGWVKKNYSSSDYTIISANSDYIFNASSFFTAYVHWLNSNLELPEKYASIPERMKHYYDECMVRGAQILRDKSFSKNDDDDDSTPVAIVRISPQQRLMNKINETIMADLDELVDAWIDKQEPEFDIYSKFKVHDLSGMAVAPVRKVIESWLSEYSDAYTGACEQAVEAYRHMSKPSLRKRVKTLEGMLSDLDRIKSAAKATRKVRVPKARAADKQVGKLAYCKESTEFKIKSIAPITIVGAMWLYVFNTKTREITEYVSGSTSGFEVKGTTIQNISEDSRKVRLRKPDDMLPILLSKTTKQIDNAWLKLTTKTSTPNGRINSDCILLRALR